MEIRDAALLLKDKSKRSQESVAFFDPALFFKTIYVFFLPSFQGDSFSASSASSSTSSSARRRYSARQAGSEPSMQASLPSRAKSQVRVDSLHVCLFVCLFVFIFVLFRFFYRLPLNSLKCPPEVFLDICDFLTHANPLYVS